MFIPSKFEDAVTTKVVTQQQAATVLMQRNVTLVEAETNVINSLAEADSAVTIGEASAKSKNLTSSAVATAMKITQQAKAQGLASIASVLNLNVNETLAYKYTRLLSSVGYDKDLVIGFEDAVMNTRT